MMHALKQVAPIPREAPPPSAFNAIVDGVRSKHHTAVHVPHIGISAIMWVARLLGYRVVGVPGNGLFMIVITPYHKGRQFMAFRTAVDVWTTSFIYGRLTVLVIFVWPISLPAAKPTPPRAPHPVTGL